MSQHLKSLPKNLPKQIYSQNIQTLKELLTSEKCPSCIHQQCNVIFPNVFRSLIVPEKTGNQTATCQMSRRRSQVAAPGRKVFMLSGLSQEERKRLHRHIQQLGGTVLECQVGHVRHTSWEALCSSVRQDMSDIHLLLLSFMKNYEPLLLLVLPLSNFKMSMQGC